MEWTSDITSPTQSQVQARLSITALCPSTAYDWPPSSVPIAYLVMSSSDHSHRDTPLPWVVMLSPTEMAVFRREQLSSLHETEREHTRGITMLSGLGKINDSMIAERKKQYHEDCEPLVLPSLFDEDSASAESPTSALKSMYEHHTAHIDRLHERQSSICERIAKMEADKNAVSSAMRYLVSSSPPNSLLVGVPVCGGWPNRVSNASEHSTARAAGSLANSDRFTAPDAPREEQDDRPSSRGSPQ